MSMDYLNIQLALGLTNSCFFSRVKLTPTARIMLTQLVNHVNSQTLCLNPSYDRLALCCGCERTVAISAVKELCEKKILQKVQTTIKNKPRNFYKLTSNVYLEIDLGLINSGKKPLFKDFYSQENTLDIVVNSDEISDKKLLKHEKNMSINNFSGFFQKKFKFLSETQKKYEETIKNMSEEECRIYWQEKQGFEKEGYLEQKRLEQIAKQRKSEEEQKKLQEEEERKKNDTHENRKKTQLIIWATGYKMKGERLFHDKERQEEMKKFGITEAEIRDSAKGYEQKELTTV